MQNCPILIENSMTCSSSQILKQSSLLKRLEIFESTKTQHLTRLFANKRKVILKWLNIKHYIKVLKRIPTAKEVFFIFRAGHFRENVLLTVPHEVSGSPLKRVQVIRTTSASIFRIPGKLDLIEFRVSLYFPNSRYN